MVNYDEYSEVEYSPDKEKLARYWSIGKGMQAVDGLETSKYLEEVITKNIHGTYTHVESIQDLTHHYSEDLTSPQAEADIVAARITALLDTASFRFKPSELRFIHSELFEGILQPSWVGEYKLKNYSKKEEILGGETVRYGEATQVSNSLKYDFEQAVADDIIGSLHKGDYEPLQDFISDIWQTHPFREGNTRTIGVFLQLLLKGEGFDITNEPFKEHSRYFRDALVRANFSDRETATLADKKPLTLFFGNIIQNQNNILKEEDLYLPAQTREILHKRVIARSKEIRDKPQE